MASLSGVSSSNYLSSLMNSANTITGLASGLDTESMIESLVQSYQTKINQFNQKITKLEWKQEAYRSLISQMYNFANKYTSYTSSTNLMSPSFFSSAVKVSTLGKFADLVTASGKTSSNVSLNAVHQLATAAQYRTSSNLSVGDGTSIEASEAVYLDSTTTRATLDGSLTLKNGSYETKITFDQDDVKTIEQIREDLGPDASEKEVLAELINRKLAEQTINTSDGYTENADKFFKAKVGENGIEFEDAKGAGNEFFISNATGTFADTFGLSGRLTDKPTSFTVSDDLKLTKEVSNREYLSASGRTMTISLDGTTKTITLPEIFEGEDGKTYIRDPDAGEENQYRVEYTADKYAEMLNKEVQKAFGSKIEVSNAAEDGEGLKLRFEVKDSSSSLSISSDAGDVLGIGKSATNYLTTSKTLGELLSDEQWSALTPTGEKDENGNDLYEFKINDVVVGTYSKDTKLSDLMNDINKSDAGVKVSYSQTTKNFLFEAKETGADSRVEFGEGLAKTMFGTSAKSSDTVSDTFEGVDWGEEGTKSIYFKVPDGDGMFLNITSDMTMDQIVEKLNNSKLNSIKGYEFSYDDNTGKIVVNDGNKTQDVQIATETHDEMVDGITKVVIDEQLEYKNDSKFSYTAGQDAIFDVTVNGETMQMTRSSNTVNIDGLSITMNDTFNSKVGDNGKFEVDNKLDAVTFKTSTDSDKLVDAIKNMIAEYNVMMADIRSAYSSMPYQKSDGTYGYDPLTDDDMEGMSESAIARYEEKAKQGLLFGDQNLSSLYNSMLDVFSFNNAEDWNTLQEMGISISYSSSDGSQTITLDEEKLRDLLDSDPDRVADLFTKSDGIMDRMKTQMDKYAKTTGEPKGILVQQAGTPLSSLSLMSNQWQTEIDNYNDQISKWQTKLESQVERYTSQFARLEQLISQMNSQSSALAGMLGN